MSEDHPILMALTTPDLTAHTRMIYAYLVAEANGARLCWRRTDEIQSALGIKTRYSVCAATDELERRGLIRKQRRYGDSNHYFILDPDGRLYGVQSNEQLMVHSDEQSIVQSNAQSAVSIVQANAQSASDGEVSLFSGPNKSQEDKKVSKKEDSIGSKRAKKSTKAVGPIPEDWQPDEGGLKFAKDRGVNIAAQVPKFIYHHLSKDNRLNWSFAWRTWCLNAVSFGTAPGRPIKDEPVFNGGWKPTPMVGGLS